jgi:hypothetical protein
MLLERVNLENQKANIFMFLLMKFEIIFVS